MITMERVLNSWPKVKNMDALAEDYRLEVWKTNSGDLYMIEMSTNSGFLVEKNGEIQLILSGVTYDMYYNTENLVIKQQDDLKKLFKKLVKKEKLNKDRLSNIMIFLEDVATRDRIGLRDNVTAN